MEKKIFIQWTDPLKLTVSFVFILERFSPIFYLFASCASSRETYIC